MMVIINGFSIFKKLIININLAEKILKEYETK